jgi:CBS domain-containing protein
MPQVRDLMVSSVVTIEPATSIVDAARRMIQEEKGPLPVVEGESPRGDGYRPRHNRAGGCRGSRP